MRKGTAAVVVILLLVTLAGCKTGNPPTPRMPSPTFNPYPYKTPAKGDALVLTIGEEIPAGRYEFTVPGKGNSICHYEVEERDGSTYPNAFANGGDVFTVTLSPKGGKLITIGCGFPRRLR